MDERYEGGLWCHEVLDHLDAYVDGSLTAEQLTAVQQHVRVCQACAQFGAAYAGVVQTLRSTPVPVPKGGVLDRLHRRLSDLEQV
jgi:anti-sigma factor RsiW